MSQALVTLAVDNTDPLDALADRYLADHRILQKALPPMVERVLNDGDLRCAALEKLIEAECRRTLEARLAFAHQVHKRATGGGPIGQQRANNLAGHAAAIAASLLDDFRLPNGRKLGDAGRNDLHAALSSYQIQSDDARVKQRWLTLILQCVGSGQTVRQALTPERAEELRAEARKAEQ